MLVCFLKRIPSIFSHSKQRRAMGDEATYFEAYGRISYGNELEPCRKDGECLPGLKCLSDDLTGDHFCKFPAGIEWGPTQSEYDPECHRLTKEGTRVALPERMCPPPLKLPPPLFTSEQVCSHARNYHHLPSGKDFCVATFEDGTVTRAPEKCCAISRDYQGDLEAEYVKFGKSPQYYGVWR